MMTVLAMRRIGGVVEEEEEEEGVGASLHLLPDLLVWRVILLHIIGCWDFIDGCMVITAPTW